MIKNFILISVFLFSSLYADEKALEKVSIQLKWFYQYQFAGILMAKEKGFFEKAGLDVTIKERVPKYNNIKQVIEGESEYGLADSVILRYRAEGYPVKVLATIFQHNAMVLISKKESGIVSPYEMRGKRISYQEGLDDSIITSTLNFAGLNKSDFIKMPMDFSHMDFVNGKVDVSEAYMSIEPYWMKQKYGIDVNVIDPKNYGIDFYGDLLFTTEEEINKHPQRAEAFKNATLEGWAYALQHKEEAIDIILEKYNTRDLNREQLIYEARVTQNLISTNYIPLGDVRKSRFKVLADLYAEHGVSKDSLDLAVENIIHDPSQKENIFEQYLYPIVWASGILLIVVTLLVYYNARLSYLVRTRTKELEEAKSDAESAAKSKSAFLANMSHEIRTPMNAILGFVEQLAKAEQDPLRQGMFKTIENSGQTLLTIINDILDISKIDTGKVELELRPLHLRSLFEEIHLLFDSSAQEKMITLSLHIEESVPNCSMLDSTRLKQVLSNLINNAIKFTQEDGHINLSIAYNAQAETLEIFVVDDGVGIAKENIDKIFQVFEQEDSSTTRRFGGTGLGLAISKRLVELMNGSISVQSTQGKGSKFYIKLPHLICENEVEIDEKSNVELDAGSLEGKVLIVEDNKTNQMLLSLILDEFSLEYEIANNGQEAVDMFSESRDYSVILMDENMPVMNGIEAVKHIREIEDENGYTTVPIIAVTANALDGDRERFIEAGMDGYIAKPYSEETIKKTLVHYMRN